MAKTDLLQTEQEHHKRAFELYCSLEGKRSYDKVAAAMQVASSTVRLWARSFHWQQRLREREAEIARRVADQTLQSQVDERGRRRKIVHMALMKLAKGIADGSVRMQLGDLEHLIRLQDYLDGNPLKPEQMRDPKEIAAFLGQFFDSLDQDTQAEVLRLLDGGMVALDAPLNTVGREEPQ